MITSSLEGVDFLAVNTDANSLKNSNTERRIQMGASITSGLGAGASPEIGRTAAKESINEIMEYLKDTNMVFITAGMGGGTGTGGTPVIAKAAREKGILTVGIVTKPFHFEGAHRMELAEKGIEELSNFVDTLIVIPNQNLFRLANENTTFSDAFRMADEVLYSGVRSVTDLITMPGMINLEFADIRSVMQNMGKAMVGTGEAIGNRRAIAAAEAAITNPLLENYSMKSAKGVLINIAGGSDMTLFEVDEAANRIRSEVDENAYIIFGSTFENNLEGKIRVSVIATGIAISKNERSMPRTRSAENSASTPTSTADNTIPQSMKAFSMSEEAASTLLPDEDVNTPIPKKFALYAIEGGLAEISSHSPQTKLEKPVIKRAGSLFKKLLSSWGGATLMNSSGLDKILIKSNKPSEPGNPLALFTLSINVEKFTQKEIV